MFYKSIRFKISILYMAVLALTLASFGVGLYHNLKTALYGNMDTLLLSRAEGIAQAINTYWETSNIEAGYSPAQAGPLKKRRNVDFAKSAEKWVKSRSSDPKLIDIIVHIFDTDGAIIASSKKIQDLPIIPDKQLLSVMQGNRRYDTLASETPEDKIVLRVFTTPVFENEKVAYIVQVSSPLESIEAALANLKFEFLLLFPIAIFTTGLLGVFLARVTLSPVNTMIKTINKITARNMKLKLAVPDTRDEIQKLAETFNAMLESLERSFSAQRQLFEDLSHELKTPLTILKGEFEVVLKKLRSGKDYELVLRSALEEIDRIVKLAESLLLLARFDSKQVIPERKPVDLTELINNSINTMKGIAELKDVRIGFKGTDGSVLSADYTQLRTLFLNILDNAVKYAPKSGNVTIEVQEAGPRLKISINNSGEAIPSAELPHIFDRFYRIDKARGNNDGFGLGLSIARSIVEMHLGSISAESRPHEGTTFIITLPRNIS